MPRRIRILHLFTNGVDVMLKVVPSLVAHLLHGRKQGLSFFVWRNLLGTHSRRKLALVVIREEDSHHHHQRAVHGQDNRNRIEFHGRAG